MLSDSCPLDKTGLGKTHVSDAVDNAKTFKPIWDKKINRHDCRILCCRLELVKTGKFISAWWPGSTINFMLWPCLSLGPVEVSSQWSVKIVAYPNLLCICIVSETMHSTFHCLLPVCLKTWCHGRWFDRLWMICYESYLTCIWVLRGGWNINILIATFSFVKKLESSKQFNLKTVHSGLQFDPMTLRHRGIISALRQSLAAEVETGWIPISFLILLYSELKLDYACVIILYDYMI